MINRTYFYVGGFIIGTLAFYWIGAFTPLNYIWQKTFSGISGGIYRGAIILRELPLWKEKNILLQNIDALQNEALEVQSLRAQVQSLKAENESIRNALHWSSDKERRYIISKVIGKPIDTPNTYFIINQGKNQGIKPGFPVIIGEDIIIGEIVSVEDNTAYLRLLSDNLSKISVKKLTDEEPIGIAEGNVGLSIVLSLVPNSTTLFSGETIVTSGLDELIPKNLIVGEVGEDIEQIDDFFKRASIRNVYDPNQINIVSVITNTLD